MKNKLSLFLLSLLMLAGPACDNAPVSKLVNPTVANTTGTWQGDSFVIYDDEIKTDGEVMMYTTEEGQVLDFSSRENPRQGYACIKYAWDGRDTVAYETGLPQHGYVGFSLIAADSTDNYLAVARNLAPGGYTRLSFWVRGALSEGVALEIKGNNANTDTWTSATPGNQITGNWQRFTVPINTASLAETRDFVRIIFTFADAGTARGNGGTVYIDDIRLER